MLAARVAAWRAAMPAAVQLHYAMKANPFAPLLAFMAGAVDGLDVASGGELAAALASGMAAQHLSFARPGQRDRQLEGALLAGAAPHPVIGREKGGRLGRRGCLSVYLWGAPYYTKKKNK